MTSLGSNLNLINNVEFDDKQLEILNENKIFKLFIFNAGSYFFKVLSSDLYENRYKDETVVFKYFEYVKWDVELVGRLNCAIDALINTSIPYIENDGSMSRALSRKRLLKDLILTYKTRIEECTSITKETYRYIYDMILQDTND